MHDRLVGARVLDVAGFSRANKGGDGRYSDKYAATPVRAMQDTKRVGGGTAEHRGKVTLPAISPMTISGP